MYANRSKAPLLVTTMHANLSHFISNHLNHLKVCVIVDKCSTSHPMFSKTVCNARTCWFFKWSFPKAAYVTGPVNFWLSSVGIWMSMLAVHLPKRTSCTVLHSTTFQAPLFFWGGGGWCSTCCLVLLVGLTEKCRSFMPFSIIVTV